MLQKMKVPKLAKVSYTRYIKLHEQGSRPAMGSSYLCVLEAPAGHKIPAATCLPSYSGQSHGAVKEGIFSSHIGLGSRHFTPLPSSHNGRLHG